MYNNYLYLYMYFNCICAILNVVLIPAILFSITISYIDQRCSETTWNSETEGNEILFFFFFWFL